MIPGGLGLINAKMLPQGITVNDFNNSKLIITISINLSPSGAERIA